MEAGGAAWLVILLALVLANLPFFNDRILALFPLPVVLTASGAGASPETPPRKPFLLRLLELVLLYFAVGAVGMLLEGRIGTVFPQTWEFYAITGCMFLVFAFPGFVVRYLRKH
ncbi:DUF2818 family protein [Pseudoduganella lurida]|nr:DUF2818 family protein [Pseudoduganella lurida]